jgi:hypothetical protein
MMTRDIIIHSGKEGQAKEKEDYLLKKCYNRLQSCLACIINQGTPLLVKLAGGCAEIIKETKNT